jgi:hypothetical protein
MITPIIMLAIGFILLIKGGDWFVDGATGIARRFHLPEILIGATVVSIREQQEKALYCQFHFSIFHHCFIV